MEEARTKLGRLADEVSESDEHVVLTRRGRAVAVLMSAEEYERVLEDRRRLAQLELAGRLQDLRERVAAAGLDPAIVEEALTAARRSG